MPGDEPVERQGRLDAGDLGLVEGAPQAVDGGRPVAGVDHDLGQQVVVVGRDPVAGLEPGVDPDPGTGRHDPLSDPAWARREVAGRILGRETDLDRVTLGLGRPVGGGQHRRRERLPGRQPELLLDHVDAGDQLADTVLDLEPGVDLEEVEGTVRGAQELRGRGVAQPGGRGDADRQVVEVAPLVGGQTGRRRLLDQFLVAPLERTIALADGHDPAGRVAQQLDLDVARRPDLALEEDRAVAEGGRRLGRPGGQRGRQFGRRRHPAHPASATAGRRLDQQREADPLRLREDRRQGVGSVDRDRIDRPRDALDADGSGEPARLDLVAQCLDDGRRWSDEDEARLLDGTGERRPLGQEPVARMDRLGPGRPGRLDDRVDPEVALGRWRADPAGRRRRPSGRAGRRRPHRCRRPPLPSRVRGSPG